MAQSRSYSFVVLLLALTLGAGLVGQSAAQEITTTDSRFDHTLFQGQMPSIDSFFVINSGDAPLTYTIDVDAEWLSVTPPGSSVEPGADQLQTIRYHTATLSAGTHVANICVNGNAPNSPLCVVVTLTVLPTPPPEIVGAPGGGDHLFSAAFGGFDFDEGEDIEVDSSGNIIVTGTMTDVFGTALDFGGGILSGTGFIAKFDDAGNHIWSKGFSASFLGVTVDSFDNIIVSGTFEEPADFGGGPETPTGSSIVVLKYDAAGNFLWSRIFSGPALGIGFDVAVDRLDNIAVTGILIDGLGVTRIFVGNFEPNGTIIWIHLFRSLGSSVGFSVTFDAFGNTVITGQLESAVDFGGGTLIPSGFSDIFVASYDSAGIHRWSKKIGGAGVDFGSRIAGDLFGDVFVTGAFEQSVDFGGGPVASSGLWDVFVAKYDSNGAHIWSRTAGSVFDDVGVGIATDARGNVAVTGFFEGTADFGGGSVSSSGNWDVFVATYDAMGAHVWSGAFGNEGFDVGAGIDIDALGDVHVTGSFQGAIDMGGGPLGGYFSTGAPSSDIFIAELRGALPGSAPHIALSTTSLSATTNEGDSPPFQTFMVSNSGLGVLDYAITDNASWLNVSPVGGTVTTEFDTINVIFNTASLVPDLYSAIITVTDTNSGNTDEVLVELEVLERPEISVSPASIARSIVQGETAPDGEIAIENVGGGILNYTITDDASWLVVDPPGGTSASSEADFHTVSFVTSALAVGTHTATISIADPAASNSPQTISVSVNVSRAPLLSVNPSILSPRVAEGTNAPSQIFIVTNAGGGTLDYTISDSASWVFTNPVSGTSSGETDTIEVLYGTASLAPGTYAAVITVTDTGSGVSDDVVIALTVEGAVSSRGAGSSSGGGCFIATATYGTPMAAEIDALRAVRDEYLLTNWFGTIFVDTYYRVSTPIADVVSRSPILRAVVRAVLMPIIAASNLLLGAPGVATVAFLLASAVLSVGLRRHRRRYAARP